VTFSQTLSPTNLRQVWDCIFRLLPDSTPRAPKERKPGKPESDCTAHWLFRSQLSPLPLTLSLGWAPS